MASYIIYGDAADDYIFGSQNASYATASTLPSPAVNGASGTVLAAGQTNTAGSYQCFESFVSFNTSGVIGVIQSGTLDLFVISINALVSTDALEARVYDWGTAVDVANDTQTGSQYAALTLAGSRVVSSIVAGAYNSLAIAAGANINATSARYILSTAFFAAATAPIVAGEYAQINSADSAGTVNDPRLTVFDNSIGLQYIGAQVSGASGNVSVVIPNGAAVGDLLLIAFASADNVTSTLPAGWTKQQETNSGTGLRLTTAWKVCVAGEPGSSVTITHTAGALIVARAYVAIGTATSAPLDTDAVPGTGTGVSATLPTLTSGVNNALILGLTAWANDAAITTWSGTTPTLTPTGNTLSPATFALRGNITTGNNAGGGTTITVNLPSGLVVGDLLICAVTIRGTTSTVTRTGWTLDHSKADAATSITRVLRRTVDGTEGASAIFTCTSAKASGCCIAIVGANNATLDYASQANASSATTTGPSITPGAYAALIVLVGGTSVGTTLTTGFTINGGNTSGFGQTASTGGSAATRTSTFLGVTPVDTPVNSGSATGAMTIGAADAATNVGITIAVRAATPAINFDLAWGKLATAGATSARTVTSTVSAAWAAQTFSFKPLAAAAFTFDFTPPSRHAPVRASNW